jgi:LPXTG-motif cell wall-anchored protein
LTHSDIEWSQGGQATVSFTMGKGCTGQELSLVSYTAPSDTFSRETASQQRIFQAKTGTFGDATGAHTYVLSVNVPSCFFQIDFVTGKPIAQFGPAESNNFYSDQGRLLAGVNGGTRSCNTTNANGANDTPQTVTPSTAFVGSPTDTSANGSETPRAGSTPNGNVVAGFQTAPNAVGSVNPIVEVPGGSNQVSPNVAPTNVQNGTVAGVQSLPSTSTDGTPLPLAAVGLAIMALGGLLLRRRDTRI